MCKVISCNSLVKCSIAVLTTLFQTGIFAQNLTEGAVWDYNYVETWYARQDTVYGYWRQWLVIADGTLETNGKTYTKVWICPPTGINTSQAGSKYLSGEGGLGIREDDGRILADYADYQRYLADTRSLYIAKPDYQPYPLTDDGEIVLYDYNMEVGDKYPSVEGHEDIAVTAKDMVVLSDGKERRRLVLSNGLVLIEGIGCINSGGFFADYLNTLRHTAFCWLENVSMNDGKDILYQQTDWKFHDLSFLDIEERTFTKTANHFSGLFDLQGRRITGTPRKGVYVRDGRKYVAR